MNLQQTRSVPIERSMVSRYLSIGVMYMMSKDPGISYRKEGT